MMERENYTELKQAYRVYEKELDSYSKWRDEYYRRETEISDIERDLENCEYEDGAKPVELEYLEQLKGHLGTLKELVDLTSSSSSHYKSILRPLLQEKVADEINKYRSETKYIQAEKEALNAIAGKLKSTDFSVKLNCDNDFFFESLVHDRYIKFLENYPKDKFKRDAAIKSFAGKEGIHTRSAKVRINKALTKALHLLFSIGLLGDTEAMSKFAVAHSLSENELSKLILDVKWKLYYSGKIENRPDGKSDSDEE